MASPSNPPNDLPSLSSDIEQTLPRKMPLSLNEEERLDLKRIEEDVLAYRQGIARTTAATEPARAYKNVWLTEKQINYLLVILKPYISPIAEECRVKLESA